MCAGGGCKPLSINGKKVLSEGSLRKPQKPVMPQKPVPPHKSQHPNSERGSMQRKQMKTAAFTRPVVKPLVMKDNWGACDTRKDFLRAFALFLLICWIGGIPFGLSRMFVPTDANGGSMVLLFWVSFPVSFLVFFKGVVPYLRSKVRRVHDFGWTGYVSVILPLIVTCLVIIVKATCSVVCVTLLYVTELTSAMGGAEIAALCFLFGLTVPISIWLNYGCIVFPYLQGQLADPDIKVAGIIKVVGIAKEKSRIWMALFIGAALGVMSFFLACFNIFLEAILSLTCGVIGLLCALWSIFVCLICLFRKGNAVELTGSGDCSN